MGSLVVAPERSIVTHLLVWSMIKYLIPKIFSADASVASGMR